MTKKKKKSMVAKDMETRREEQTSGSKGIFRAVKLFCMILQW
jgi:hypothetical protein